MTEERCQAETKSGQQCSRPAHEGELCWQHAGDNVSHTSRSKLRKFEPEQVAEVIREADGNVTSAAEALGCSRYMIYDYCDQFEVCEQAKQRSRRALIDDAKNTLKDEMEDAENARDRIRAAEVVIDNYDHTTVPDKMDVDKRSEVTEKIRVDVGQRSTEELERIAWGDENERLERSPHQLEQATDIDFDSDEQS